MCWKFHQRASFINSTSFNPTLLFWKNHLLCIDDKSDELTGLNWPDNPECLFWEALSKQLVASHHVCLRKFRRIWYSICRIATLCAVLTGRWNFCHHEQGRCSFSPIRHLRGEFEGGLIHTSRKSIIPIMVESPYGSGTTTKWQLETVSAIPEIQLKGWNKQSLNQISRKLQTVRVDSMFSKVQNTEQRMLWWQISARLPETPPKQRANQCKEQSAVSQWNTGGKAEISQGP